MIFKYRSIDSSGRAVDGELHADDRKAALAQIKAQGLRATKLVGMEQPRNTLLGRTERSVSSGELLMTLSELATLLRAGVSLKESIDSLSAGDRSSGLTKTIDHWSAALRQGESFSAALAQSGVDLPPYVIQLAQAGELTGELGLTLQKAVDQMHYEKSISEEMKNALVYPAILLASGIGAVLLVFTFVVPKFENLLETGNELPWLATAVLVSGQWVNNNGALMLALIAIPVLLVAHLLSRPATVAVILDVLQHAPIVGDWISASETSRWASTMAALVKYRVPILTALDLAQQSVKIPSRKRRLDRAAAQVRAGIPLSTALQENAVITGTGFNLLRAGEKSGEVARLLEGLAELHDSETQTRMKRFLTIIEPTAILLIGSFIGVIILGVILAITSANEVVL